MDTALCKATAGCFEDTTRQKPCTADSRGNATVGAKSRQALHLAASVVHLGPTPLRPRSPRASAWETTLGTADPQTPKPRIKPQTLNQEQLKPVIISGIAHLPNLRNPALGLGSSLSSG